MHKYVLFSNLGHFYPSLKIEGHLLDLFYRLEKKLSSKLSLIHCDKVVYTMPYTHALDIDEIIIKQQS